VAGLWRGVADRRYRRWTREDGELQQGAIEEWIEIGPDGIVLREIAFDEAGKVVHLMPSDKYPDGTYGHFDLAPVHMTGPDSVDPQEFEQRWQEAEQLAANLPNPPGNLSRFVRWLTSRFA
jgi:hypothetical protein